MPAYGKKSEPPRKAISEMKSKQSKDSSTDPFHNGMHQVKTKGKPTR